MDTAFSIDPKGNPAQPSFFSKLWRKEFRGGIIFAAFQLILLSSLYADGTEDFETYDELQPLATLPGWSVNFGDAFVKSDVGGGKVLCLKGGTNPSVEVAKDTTPWTMNSNSGVTWIKFRIRPVVEIGAFQESSIEVNGSVISFTKKEEVSGASTPSAFSGSIGGINYLDGGTWRSDENVAFWLGSDGRTSVSWLDVTIRQNLPGMKWDLYINNRLVVANLALASPFSSRVSEWLGFGCRAPLDVLIDDLVVADTDFSPFGDTFNNGLRDSWESTLGPTWLPNSNRDNTVPSGVGSGLQHFLAAEIAAYKLENALNLADIDSDGLPDTWEVRWGLDPNDQTDSGKDQDFDGKTSLQEYYLGTNPFSPPLFKLHEIVPPERLRDGLRGFTMAHHRALSKAAAEASPDGTFGWALINAKRSNGDSIPFLVKLTTDGPVSMELDLPETGSTEGYHNFTANFVNTSGCVIGSCQDPNWNFKTFTTSPIPGSFRFIPCPIGYGAFLPVSLSDAGIANFRNYYSGDALRVNLATPTLQTGDIISGYTGIHMENARGDLVLSQYLSNAGTVYSRVSGDDPTGCDATAIAAPASLGGGVSGVYPLALGIDGLAVARCYRNGTFCLFGLGLDDQFQIFNTNLQPSNINLDWISSLIPLPSGGAVAVHQGSNSYRILKWSSPTANPKIVTEFGWNCFNLVGANDRGELVWNETGGSGRPRIFRNGSSFDLEGSTSKNSTVAVISASALFEGGAVIATGLGASGKGVFLLEPLGDVDGDGLSTSWESDPEHSHFSDFDTADSMRDDDRDGLNNKYEFLVTTNPFSYDSDRDGMPDPWEIEKKMNPLDPTDAGLDYDGDRLTNYQEFRNHSDPLGNHQFTFFPLPQTEGYWSNVSVVDVNTFGDVLLQISGYRYSDMQYGTFGCIYNGDTGALTMLEQHPWSNPWQDIWWSAFNDSRQVIGTAFDSQTGASQVVGSGPYGFYETAFTAYSASVCGLSNSGNAGFIGYDSDWAFSSSILNISDQTQAPSVGHLYGFGDNDWNFGYGSMGYYTAQGVDPINQSISGGYPIAINGNGELLGYADGGGGAIKWSNGDSEIIPISDAFRYYGYLALYKFNDQGAILGYSDHGPWIYRNGYTFHVGRLATWGSSGSYSDATYLDNTGAIYGAANRDEGVGFYRLKRNSDADGDGIADDWENYHMGNTSLGPNSLVEGHRYLIGNNQYATMTLDELYQNGLLPHVFDYDQDGLSDLWELRNGKNPKQFDPPVLANHPYISEFMASNSSIEILGTKPDWIEIHNPTDHPINLGSYQVRYWKRDYKNNGQPKGVILWTCPSVDLQPNGHIVFIADAVPVGKSQYSDPPNSYYMGFNLRAEGAYLALEYVPAGGGVEICNQFAATYPQQFKDVSYGVTHQRDAVGYFATPTMGMENGDHALKGRAPTPLFDTNGGVFESQVLLAQYVNYGSSADGKRSDVRYTLDSSDPRTSPTAQNYFSSIPIYKTTIFKATAIEDGMLPSEPVALSFLYPREVKDQLAPPDGRYSEAVDYAINPANLAASNGHPSIWPQVLASLKSLPTLSLAADPAELFGDAGGIYPSAPRRELDRPIPASMELLNRAPSEPAIGVNCALEMQGGYSRQEPKKTLRLSFRSDYGASSLSATIFKDANGNELFQDFDSLVLSPLSLDNFATAASVNLTPPSEGNAATLYSPNNATYVKNAFAAACQELLGLRVARQRYTHLYLNGMYWGIYQISEKPDERFFAKAHGNQPETDHSEGYHDIIHDGEVVAGDKQAWNQLHAVVKELAQLEKLKHRAGEREAPSQYISNLDDDRDAALAKVESLLDLTKFVDYMLLHTWLRVEDWPKQNYYAGRFKDPDGWGYNTKFEFVNWDANFALRGRVTTLPTEGEKNFVEKFASCLEGPGALFYGLSQVAEFADLVVARKQFLFNSVDGLLTQSGSLLDALKTEITPHLGSDFSRWGKHPTLTDSQNVVQGQATSTWGQFQFPPGLGGVFPNDLITLPPPVNQSGSYGDVVLDKKKYDVMVSIRPENRLLPTNGVQVAMGAEMIHEATETFPKFADYNLYIKYPKNTLGTGGPSTNPPVTPPSSYNYPLPSTSPPTTYPPPTYPPEYTDPPELENYGRIRLTLTGAIGYLFDYFGFPQTSWSSQIDATGTPIDGDLKDNNIPIPIHLKDFINADSGNIVCEFGYTPPHFKGQSAPKEQTDVFNFRFGDGVDFPEPPPGAQLTNNEVGSPRYRKVSLVGMPIADGKPQAKEESDSDTAETYVDALTLSLNHSTTDLAVAVPGSEIGLAVRRTVVEETEPDSLGGGAPLDSPAWKIERPFGPCWRSGVVSYMRWTHRVAPPIPGRRAEPVYTEVIDENGSVHRFLPVLSKAWRDDPNTPAQPTLEDILTNTIFIPVPGSATEQDGLEMRLTKNGNTFEFTKKFGNKLVFQMGTSDSWIKTDYITNQWEIEHPSDPLNPPPAQKVENVYARLASVTDRLGYVVQYNYGNNNKTLIPLSITSASRTISISTIDEGSGIPKYRIGSITVTVEDAEDAEGVVDMENRVEYEWSMLGDVPYITGVTRGFQTAPAGVPQALSHISYSAEHFVEPDMTPREITASVVPKPRSSFNHINLTSITSAAGATYSFTYGQDYSKLHYQSFGSSPGYPGYYTPSGLSRVVTSTSTPDGTANFTQVGSPIYLSGKMIDKRTLAAILAGAPGPVTSDTVTVPTVFGDRATLVTSAVGTSRLYRFADPAVMDAEEYHDLLVGPTGEPLHMAFLIQWQKMDLVHPNGRKEIFEFDAGAGGAPKKVTDYSGNVTQFEYEDRIPKNHLLSDNFPQFIKALAQNNSPLVTGRRSDPTAQINALGLRKTFVYGAHRMMTESVDEAGTVTETDVEDDGRRKTEVVTGANGDLLKKAIFDYSLDYPGVVTEEIIQDFSGNLPITTTYDLDGNGFVEEKRIGNAADLVKVTMTNDAMGNVKSSKDGLGRITTYTYDSQNRLLTSTLPADVEIAVYGQPGTQLKTLTTEIRYDAGGRKVAERDPANVWTYYGYDNSGRQTSVTRSMSGSPGESSGSITTSQSFNALGQVVTSTDANGNRSSNEYDGLSRLTATTDAMGNRTTFIYDPEGVVNVGGTAFDTTSFKPSYKIDARGFVSSFVYDRLYRLISTKVGYDLADTGKVASTTTAYDAVGNPVLVTDPVGIQTVTYFDGLGRAVDAYTGLNGISPNLVIRPHDKHQTWARPTGANYRAHKEYHQTGGVALEEIHWQTAGEEGENNGQMRVRQVRTHFDSAGRVKAVIQGAAGNGLADHPTVAVSASGNCLSTTNEYDEAGNLVTVRVHKGYSRMGTGGNLQQTQVTRTLYDKLNRAYMTISNPLGEPSTTGTDASDIVVRKFFDAAGNAVRVIDPEGTVTESKYDFANRVVATTQRGNAAGGGYEILPPGSSIPVTTEITSRTTYDANGNVIRSVDANGNAVVNTYDALNRLVSTKSNPVVPATATPHAADIVVQNTYDASGNLIAVLDGKSQLTTWTYDGLGRKLTEIAGDNDASGGDTTTFVYNGALLITKKKPDGVEINFHYDDWQRVAIIMYLVPTVNGPIADPSQHRVYSYDANGDLRSVTYPLETNADARLAKNVAYDYDFLGRVTREISCGVAHEYRYDLAGNRILATYGGTGTSLVTRYDLLNRVKSIEEYAVQPTAAQVAAGGGTPRVTAYQYDKAGRVKVQTQANGLATTTTYNSLGRAISVATPGEQPDEYVQKVDYVHDAVGNVRRITENNALANVPDRVVENSYDRVHRLAKESVAPSGSTTAFPVVTLYTYDKANNRTQKQMMGSLRSESRYYRFFNKFNQIKSVANSAGQTLVEYTYDKNGNRLRREVNGKMDRYTWDGDNRLVALTVDTLPFPDPAGTSLQPSIPAVTAGFYHYTYDYRTRRTLREERSSDTVPWQQRFVSFSGGTSVQERNAPGVTTLTPVLVQVDPPTLPTPPPVPPSTIPRVLPPILTEGLVNLSDLVPDWARYASDADGDGYPNLHEANSRHNMLTWKALSMNSDLSFVTPLHPDPAIRKIPGLVGNFYALFNDPNGDVGRALFDDGLTKVTETPFEGTPIVIHVPLFSHYNAIGTDIDWDSWANYFTILGPELAAAATTVHQPYSAPSFDKMPLVLRPDADMDRDGKSNWKNFLENTTLTEPKSMAGYLVYVGNILKDSLKAVRLYGEGGQTANFETAHLARLTTFMVEGTGTREDRFRSYFTDAPRVFGAQYASYVVDESGLPLCARKDSPNWRDKPNATGGLKTNYELYTEFMTVQNATGAGWTPRHYGQWAIGHILLVSGTVKEEFPNIHPTPETSTPVVLNQPVGQDQALPEIGEEDPEPPLIPENLEVEYIRGSDMGGGVGGLLYSKRRNAAGTGLENSFNLSNGRGDVTTQTRDDKMVTWQASYEAFGMRTSEDGVNRDRQRANTKEEDPSGLLNEGFRYRDLEAGVFISRDPAGFVDGPNVYCYVVQNPWTKFDPEGLDSYDIGGFFMGAHASAFAKDGGKMYQYRNAYRQSAGVLTGASLALHPKVQALAKAGGGTLEIIGGAISLAAPEPTGATKALGYAGLVHGADTFAAAVQQFNSEETQRTYTSAGISMGLQKLGVDKNEADTWGELADFTIGATLTASNAVSSSIRTESQIPGKVAELASHSSNCFTKGTPVWTVSGVVPIETVEVGDLVWTVDIYGSGKWQLCPVQACFAHEYEGILVYITAGDIEVCATENHPFWVVDGSELTARPACSHLPQNEATYFRNGRWVGAADLRVGDILLSKEGRLLSIQKLTTQSGRCMVFNLRVEQNHDYAVGAGVLVHNQGGTRLRSGNFFGLTQETALDQRPKGWKKVPVEKGNGWRLLDENDIERVRFMRPTKSGVIPDWDRQKSGYWIRKNEKGLFLDERGIVINDKKTLVKELTPEERERSHIRYSGADHK